jgi:hypothetical protein
MVVVVASNCVTSCIAPSYTRGIKVSVHNVVIPCSALAIASRSSQQDHTSAASRVEVEQSYPHLTIMAFVHPSRMALIPKDSRSLPPPASLPHPRPSSTNRGRDQSADRNPRRSRDEEYNGERERGGRSDHSRNYLDRNDERRRDRGRSSDRDVHRDQDRLQSRHRSNGDRFNDRRDENRDSNSKGPRAQQDDRSSVRSPPPPSKSTLGRASPSYDDYPRRHSVPSPPPRDDRPGRPDSPSENGPPWRQQENMYRRDGRLDGGDDYFDR